MSGVDFLTSFFCSLEMKFLSGVVLLLALSGVTHGQENDPVMVSVEEGRDVLLPCSLVGTNIESKLFDWRKVGETGELKKEVFMYDAGDHYNNGLNGQDPQFKGRVSHFQDELKHGNASILITKTKVADSGDYTCVFLEPSQSLQPIQTSHIKLLVVVVEKTLKDRSETTGASPEPSFRILDGPEDGALLLQCDVLGAFPKPTVRWQDSDGNILPAEETEVTERGGKYDVTVLTTVTKTDHYRCVSTQEEINQTVASGTCFVYKGASPKPYVSTLHQTDVTALLQCEVRGASPKPELQWQDSEGKVIPAKEPQVTERGGSYDVILQTTVRKTDHYRCVSTQEGIKHIVASETCVYVHGASPKPYVSTLHQTDVTALLQCEVLGANPKPKVQWQDSQGNIIPAKEPQVTYKAGRRDVTLQTTVTKTDHYSCVVTQEGIPYHTDAETHVFITDCSTERVTIRWLAALAGIFVMCIAVLIALLVGRITI